MKKAVVLGCGYTALGVIQALASKGVKVIYLSTSPNRHEFSHFSRFVLEFLKAPSPVDERDKLLELLMRKKQNWEGALMIPTSDASVAFVSQNREILAARYVLAVQKWDIVKRILNKRSLYLKAQEIGIPTPKILFPDSVEILSTKKDYLCYPCILKPFESPRFSEIFNKKVLIVHDFDELIDNYMETQRHKLDVMVSEIIPGEDFRLFHYRSYIDDKGRVLAEMCTQKLQQNPPGFGVSRVTKTIPMIEDIQQLALRLLRSFSYRGVSSSEFKFDIRDNQFKLMEINVRPVSPERLFVAAGINFPYITYLDLVDKIKIPAQTYNTEIYWIDLFAEIYQLIMMIERKEFAVMNYFWPYRKKRKVFCLPFLNDPIPFIVRSLAMVKNFLRAFMNRLLS
jgi:predicted ATP-grasp superfamily ATP-dependent carboligase